MSTNDLHSTPPVNNTQPAVAGTTSQGQNESAHIQQPTHQQTTAPPMPEKDNKEDQGRFFSIPRYQPTYTGGRSYNYEEKYAPDTLGEEFSDNARVWKVYLDEAESYDDDMLKGFRDTIDSLLVFAALFSAVVTTFVIKTIEALEPDFGQITAQVTATFMQEQIQILRAAGNTTAINNIPNSTVNLDGVPASSKDLWINGLFFASLSLSLATALISVLVKQWLQAYTSLSSGNAKERAMIRQFRFSGYENWGMQGIIGGLPLILHASLGLFLVGLALYVSQLHSSLCWIVVVITLLSFIMYFGSIILPLIWIDCPYRIPILFMLFQYIMHSPAQIWEKGESLWRKSNERPQSETLYSLKDRELQYLRRGDRRHYYLADSLHWLCTLESNKSIQKIATQTLNGIFHTAHEFNRSHFSNDATIPIYIAKLDWSLMAKIAWDSFGEIGNTENTYDNQIWPSLISLWYRILPDYDSGAKFQLVKECQPPLWDAASKGHLGMVKVLVEIGVDVNVAQGFHGTALQAAAYWGHLDVVKFLVGKGADVNTVGGEYETALQAAASQGHLDVVKFLVEKGADVNAVGGEYGNALQATASQGHLDVVKFLVEKGADVNAVGERYGTALQAAALRGHLDVVKFLVEKGTDVNAVGGKYRTALQAAASLGHLDVVKFLVEKGADVNAVGREYGTALQAAAAAWRGHLDVVKFLVEKGADVNAVGREYGTALQAAALRGHLDVVKFLVEKGADVNAVEGFYGTALQVAASGRNLDVVKFLVEKGADVNAVGERYGTALQVAASGGNLDVVKFLVEKGADVNVVGGEYGTALQAAAAAWGGHLDVVKFLVEKGADVNTVGEEYGTALQAAALKGHLDVVKFLVEKGADVNTVGGRYGTALEAAQEGNKYHIAEFLQSKGARK
ncbi:hypothetical protein VKT23_010606 [Stygiomarasmius scandens]|uniref:DUF6535 domain-containing protein n=1 Tax=Marasmiellus scandens TaxID=2682957 RepID=A0ABR1JBP0_9AGAR